MFTGLIEALGIVSSLHRGTDGLDIGIHIPDLNSVAVGESIAVDGVCLTVVKTIGDDCSFQAGPETLRRTTLGDLNIGQAVNIERALRLGDRLGGHWVQGHVDRVGKISSRQPQGEWELVWFSCPEELAVQMVSKGSVAVDGVSLTVVDIKPDAFSVALIPHTLSRTTLGTKQPGALVNLETDILAKYVARYFQSISAAAAR